MALENSNISLETDLKSLKEKFIKEEALRISLQAEKGKLLSQVEKQTREVQKLEIALEDALNKMEAKSLELSNVQNAHSLLTATVTEKQNTIESLTAQSSQSQSHLMAIDNELNTHGESLHPDTEFLELALLTKRALSAEENVKHLEQELETKLLSQSELLEKSHSRIKQLEESLAQANNELSIALEKVTTSAAQEELKDEDIEDLQEQLNGAIKKIEDLESNIAKLTNDLSLMTHSAEFSKSKLESLEKEISQSKLEVDALRKEKEKIISSNESLQVKLNECELNLSNVVEAKKNSESEFARLHKELTTTISVKDTNYQNAKIQLLQAEEFFNHQKTKIAKLEENESNLRSKFNTSEAECQTLNAELSKMRDHLDTWIAKCQAAEVKVQNTIYRVL